MGISVGTPFLKDSDGTSLERFLSFLATVPLLGIYLEEIIKDRRKRLI